MKQDILHATLIDVRDRGSVCIEKKKLLWMLGRTNDGAGAWGKLHEEWREVAGDTYVLHGLTWGPFITLVASAPDDVLAKWTN